MHTTTQRWPWRPRGQKTESEVNWHDVISRTSETNVVHCSRNRQPSMLNVPNSHIMKIQHGGCRHVGFQKCQCHRIGWRYFHQVRTADTSVHLDMIAWTEIVTSSGFQRTCIQSPYRRKHLVVNNMINVRRSSWNGGISQKRVTMYLNICMISAYTDSGVPKINISKINSANFNRSRAM